MSDVVIYSSEHCPYCDRAKQLITQKGATYQEIRVDSDADQRKIMMDKSGRRSVPQIFINGNHIGGYDDLAALDADGKLDELLK